jgi:hypothetical protein
LRFEGREEEGFQSTGIGIRMATRCVGTFCQRLCDISNFVHGFVGQPSRRFPEASKSETSVQTRGDASKGLKRTYKPSGPENLSTNDPKIVARVLNTGIETDSGVIGIRPRRYGFPLPLRRTLIVESSSSSARVSSTRLPTRDKLSHRV